MAFKFEVHPTANRKWQWRLKIGDDIIARGTDYQENERDCRVEVTKIKHLVQNAPVVTTLS